MTYKLGCYLLAAIMLAGCATPASNPAPQTTRKAPNDLPFTVSSAALHGLPEVSYRDEGDVNYWEAKWLDEPFSRQVLIDYGGHLRHPDKVSESIQIFEAELSKEADYDTTQRSQGTAQVWGGTATWSYLEMVPRDPLERAAGRRYCTGFIWQSTQRSAAATGILCQRLEPKAGPIGALEELDLRPK